MADKKEHGPHPFALLREWKLAIKKTLQTHAKTELEYYKLAEFMDCLLLFSPTLDAGKVSFKATFAQLQELHNDVSRKSIYNRADRLKEMGIVLSWEQPQAKKKGEFNPTVWTVSKTSESKNKESEGKKEGVLGVKNEGLQDFTREDFTRSGHGPGQSGHITGQEGSDHTTEDRQDTDQNPTPGVLQIDDEDSPAQLLVQRLEEIVTDPAWTVDESDITQMIHTQNGKGHLVIPALSWFLDENDAQRLHLHFPGWLKAVRRYKISDYRGVLLRAIPKILAAYEETLTIPFDDMVTPKNRAYQIED